MTLRTWPETALTVCLHHVGKTSNPDSRCVDEEWAKGQYLDNLVLLTLLTQAEADAIRLRCGWAVQMRLEI